MKRGAGPLFALRGLLADLADLFPAGGKAPAILAVTLLLQIAYWYLGAPGAGAPRDPQFAMRSVLWAALLLGLLPLLFARWLRLDLRELGLRGGMDGEARTLVVAGVAIAVLVGYLATFDAGLSSAYPWPGGWAGRSPATFLTWAAIYSVYYLSYEFFYRGLLLRGLEPALGRRGSLWFQAVASTLIHLGRPLAETLAAAPAGLLFGLIALRTRSLAPVVLIHLAIGLSTDFFILTQAGSQ